MIFCIRINKSFSLNLILFQFPPFFQDAKKTFSFVPFENQKSQKKYSKKNFCVLFVASLD